MVEQGLSVPPGLKRGGYTRISTGRSIPVRKKNVASRNSDDSGLDSDAEYGQPRAKRAKTRSKVKAHTPTPSTSESEEEVPSSETSNVKRERSNRSNDQSSAGDYTQGGVEPVGEDIVGGGAGFFNLARDAPNMADITQDPSRRLIVKLPTNKATKPEGSNFSKNDLNDLATVASGLSAYDGTSAVGRHPAFDPSLPNHHYHSEANHAYNTSGFPSAGYGGMNGLPDNSLHGSMLTQPHGYYPNGYEHFGNPTLGHQGAVEQHWGLVNSDYQVGGSIPRTPATSHFLDARGTSNAMSHPPSSLTQLPTSFVSEPAGQNDLIGGDYHSSGVSTIGHTPSSILPEEFGHIPWQTRDVSTTGQTNGMDLDDMNTVQPSDIDPFHQQYDGYGDDGYGDGGYGDGGYGDDDVYF